MSLTSESSSEIFAFDRPRPLRKSPEAKRVMKIGRMGFVALLWAVMLRRVGFVLATVLPMVTMTTNDYR
eukprot:scaffold248751_cov36-Prasinocladus_malaysianus.AAC.3